MRNDKCQHCKSNRLAYISAKSSDCNAIQAPALGCDDYDGYVPGDMGIGHGDYVEFQWCLLCGQIQGEWPQPGREIGPEPEEESEEPEFDDEDEDDEDPFEDEDFYGDDDTNNFGSEVRV